MRTLKQSMLMSDERSSRALPLQPSMRQANRKRACSAGVDHSLLPEKPEKMRKCDRELALHSMMMNERSDDENEIMA